MAVSDAGELLLDLLSELENAEAHHAATGPLHDTWVLVTAAMASLATAQVILDFLPAVDLAGF